MAHEPFDIELGGLPAQEDFHQGSAIFTEAYAVIPRAVMRDIVTSFLPGWDKTHAWILARPLSGFAETFAQYLMELGPGGTSQSPEPDPEAEGVIFVLSGNATLTLEGATHALGPQSYAFLAPGARWQIVNEGDTACRFLWVRKRYEAAPDLPHPASFVTNTSGGTTIEMPDTNGAWSTTRFVDPADLSHDMHVNVVNFTPGACIPFPETHVMEHGLYVLEGGADYLLNRDWVRVGPGDFMWLRAFCPQACKVVGDAPFRYLLYKDVNRHPALALP